MGERVQGDRRASVRVGRRSRRPPIEVEPSGALGLQRRSRRLRCWCGVEDGGDGVAFACCFPFDLIAHVLRAALAVRVGAGLVDPGFDGEADFVGDGPVVEPSDDVQLGPGRLVESDREGFDRAVAKSIGGRSSGGRMLTLDSLMSGSPP